MDGVSDTLLVSSNRIHFRSVLYTPLSRNPTFGLTMLFLMLGNTINSKAQRHYWPLPYRSLRIQSTIYLLLELLCALVCNIGMKPLPMPIRYFLLCPPVR